ncbi:alpha-hydroxy acid oxidase [Sphingosinicella microcystinivorans]|uniref:alpha-hydroxy acid oxidase n=1 Tax=Sphingosinicella microcystinivorans TaxID=335406 RepID=UPI0022F3FFBB|nr:alpha-hydroxy acid oxidase [Sphingosinicella microcystinivorans]WBX84526.1 alpha-hydroxy acid oxidase [Sphingosinicella microcystinivorans]
MNRLDRAYAVADLRKAAHARLPRPVWDYLEGGADGEVSIVRNAAAFDAYPLVPRVLAGAARPDASTSLFGQRVAAPLMLSPTGMSRLFHPGKEIAAARAAARAGVFYGLSTFGTTSIEDASVPGAPKLFQLYMFRDRGLTAELLARCKAAGYHVLCLTVDTTTPGNRLRDKRHGFTVPPRLGLRSALDFALRPGWVAGLLRDRDFRLVNVGSRVPAGGTEAFLAYANREIDPAISWRDVEWLQTLWDGPIVLKGVLAIDDAVEAAKRGVNGLILSNHGGRQLDNTVAPVDAVRPIRQAVGSDLTLVVDGGVRRGGDIVRALALGADACSIGRPYLYGLAAGGEAGVARCIDLLVSELVRAMQLCGAASIVDIRARPLLV